MEFHERRIENGGEDSTLELERKKAQLLAELDASFGYVPSDQETSDDELRNTSTPESDHDVDVDILHAKKQHDPREKYFAYEKDHINKRIFENGEKKTMDVEMTAENEGKQPCNQVVSGIKLKSDTTETDQAPYIHQINYNFGNPTLALDYKKCFEENTGNCTKGCKWSPDGCVLLVCSEDRKLRLFNLPSPVASGQLHDETWQRDRNLYSLPAVTVKEQELVYDYTWYPAMRSDDPQTCCFATTCRDQPVHLWDAWNGELICSYKSYDHVDQMVAAASVAFSPDGSKLVCGFKKAIRVFNTKRPGRIFTTIDAKEQPGILSCMAFNPELPNIVAAGSYLGTLGLYNIHNNNLFCIMDKCGGGVTQVAFSSCGTKLFSGTRRDTEILCWDMRNLGNVLYSMKRQVSTNQRIYFDMDKQSSKYLVSGSTNGEILTWNLDGQGEEVPGDDVPMLRPTAHFKAHNDCANGVSLHPYYPILATSSGQRHCPEPVEDTDNVTVSSALFTRENIVEEHTVKLWWLGES